MSDSETRMAPHARPPAPFLTAQFVVTAALALAAAATSWSNNWSWLLFAVIGVFTILGDLTEVETGPKLRVSGSFLGLVVAATVLGPGPGAALGIVSIVVSWARHREAPHYFVNNLAAYAAFPLAAGVFFHETVQAGHLSSGRLGYYLLVFAAFAVALALNFLLCAGYTCWIDGVSLADKAREALIPLLSAELFSALLTIAATFLTDRLGVAGFTLFGLVIIIFQHLIGELLTSRVGAARSSASLLPTSSLAWVTARSSTP